MFEAALQKPAKSVCSPILLLFACIGENSQNASHLRDILFLLLVYFVDIEMRLLSNFYID